MRIKSLLLGSAAALAAVSGANAADAIVAAEPEPMEYVRICDAFGVGYFYIPGTETCLKIGGRVRFDAIYGDVYEPDSDGTYTNARAEIYLNTATDTEWGALKTSITARFDYDPRYDVSEIDGNNTRTRLMVATIELGGFTAGMKESLYELFLDSAGNVENDDVVDYGPSEVNMLAYTYDAGNGFSAFVALEDDGENDNDTPGGASDWVNVSGGVKYDNGTFMAAIAAGYDESEEEGAIKARVGGEFGSLNAFLMGAWNTDGDVIHSYAPGDGFVSWGDWALWAGGGYEFSDKLAANVQVAYTDNETFAAAANLEWTPVSGFLIQPEVAYTNWDNAVVDDDAWSGMLRFQRTF